MGCPINQRVCDAFDIAATDAAVDADADAVDVMLHVISSAASVSVMVKGSVCINWRSYVMAYQMHWSNIGAACYITCRPIQYAGA